MKKLLLTVTLSILTICAFSQKIKLEEGSLDFLKNEKSVEIAFTYDNVSVGSKTEADYVNGKVKDYNAKESGKGDKWYENWINDRTERFQPKFKELYNLYISEKDGPVISESANYILSINTHFIEPGFNVGVVRKNASISARCAFIEKSTGRIVAVVSITNSSANNFWGTDFDSGYRIQESYAKAGRQFAKFLIKQLKLK